MFRFVAGEEVHVSVQKKTVEEGKMYSKFVLCNTKVVSQLMKQPASNGSFAGDQRIDGSSFMLWKFL